MKKIFKLFIIICYSLLFISCDEAHTHKYVNGECSCVEKHDCVFTDGKCDCGKIDNNKNEEFIVNFNNTDINQIKVKKGEKVTKPNDPEKKGYLFKGWYADNEFSISYDFDSEVNANIELYAKWIEYTKVINNNENIAILNKEYINRYRDGNSILIDNKIKLIYANDLTSENIERLNFTGSEDDFRKIKIYGDLKTKVYINDELINFEVVSLMNSYFIDYSKETLVTVEIVSYLNNEIQNTSEILLPIGSKLVENYVSKIISSADVFNSMNGLGQCFVTLYEDENKEVEFDLNYFNNISEGKKIYAFFEEKLEYGSFINGTYKTDNNDICVFHDNKLTIYGKEYLLNSEYNGSRLSHFNYSDEKVFIELKINRFYLTNEIVISVLDEISGERIDNLFSINE